jgi:hypothetical protein
MLFFTASFDVTKAYTLRACSQATYVTVDLVCIDFQPFCISVNESVPSPFPREIYCDIIKSIALEPYVGCSHRFTDANCKL